MTWTIVQCIVLMVHSVWSCGAGDQQVRPSAEQLLREYVRPEQADKGERS